MDPYTKVDPKNRRRVKLEIVADPMICKRVDDIRLDVEMVTLSVAGFIYMFLFLT